MAAKREFWWLTKDRSSDVNEYPSTCCGAGEDSGSSAWLTRSLLIFLRRTFGELFGDDFPLPVTTPPPPPATR